MQKNRKAKTEKKAERPSYFKDMAKAKKEMDRGMKLLDKATQAYREFFMHVMKVSGSREKVMCMMYSIHHSLACLEMEELEKVWPLSGAPSSKTQTKGKE